MLQIPLVSWPPRRSRELVTVRSRVAARLVRSAAIVMAVVMAPVLAAGAADPAVVAKSGSGEIVACASCHGAQGEGMASFPRLAGLNAEYLRRQMATIADGTRKNAVMEPIVIALGEKGMREMADYYASLPPPKGTDEVPGDESPGATLALRGDWDRNIPACVSCHGPGGVGVGDSFPALAGQLPNYIVSQLKAWKDGTRKNDPLELMRHLSAKLSEAEMRDVASWFAGQRSMRAPPARESSP